MSEMQGPIKTSPNSINIKGELIDKDEILRTFDEWLKKIGVTK